MYDPPTLICTCGTCDPNPKLVRFADDLDWLRQQGVEVERYSLSSHPSAFVQQEVVKDALRTEGNNCLPLIVVNGSIVSRCTYPSRNELMEFVGVGREMQDEQTKEPEPPASPKYQKSETAVCGPGCDCEVPPSRRTMKVAVSLIVLLAVGGIFIYKALSTKSDASSNIDPKSASAFNVAPATPKPLPRAEAQSSDVAVQKKAARRSVPKDKPMAKKATTAESHQAGQKIGENLESLNALNEVAMNQDAVFIYIPGGGDVLASDKTNTAVLAAQQTLKSNNIMIGLYTLPTSSSDYASISAQVRPPSILVASKGKGMVVVSGLVTETKLLQAFTASARAGGCGPSGCGPSGCK